MDGDLIHDCVPAGDSLSAGYRPGVWDLWRVGGHGNGLAGPLSGICGSLSERPVAVSPCDIDVSKRMIKNETKERSVIMKKLFPVFLTLVMSVLMSMSAFAGVWRTGAEPN